MSVEEEAKVMQRDLASAQNAVDVRRAVEAALSLAGSWTDEATVLQATELVETAVQAAQGVDDRRLAAYVLDQKAQLLSKLDLPGEALEAVERAIQLVEDEPALKQDLNVRRTVLLSKLGRMPEAIHGLQSMLEELNPEKETGQLLRLLALQGNYHLRADQNAQAEVNFERATSLARHASTPSQVARLQLGLSRALAGQEKYQEAQAVLLEQLLIASTSELSVNTWDLLAPAIEVSYKMEDWPTLTKLTNQAIELASKQGDYKEANMHRENLISVMMRQGQLREAKSQLEIALDYARREGPAERTLVHLINLGRVCFELNDLDASVQYYQQGLTTAEAQGHQRSQITILGRMGALAAERGDFEAALEFGERAVNQAEQAGDPLVLAEQSVLLALTYRDLGQGDEAVRASQRAAQLYQQESEPKFAERARQLIEEINRDFESR